MHINSRLLTRGFFSAATLTLAALVMAPAQAETHYAVSGSAYNLDNERLLYRELYTPVNANREVTVNYVRPDGKVFATKKLIYSGDPIQPEFEYHDTRDNERTGARFNAGRLVINYDQENYRQEKEIMETVGLVVDAGFDAYIQQQWDTLVAGKSVRFRYVIPERLEVANMRARQVTADKSPLFVGSNPATWRYFVIEPANRFAAVFRNPIHLAYESDGKYLMRYQGRSNLDSDKKGTWNVRIEYEYFQ